MSDKKELEVMSAGLINSAYEIENELMILQPNYEKIDKVCRQILADVGNLRSLAFDLKRKEAIKA